VELARYDPASRSWKVDSGRYFVWMGSSSRDADLQKVGFVIP
jgi:hypothetical protein